MKKFFNLNSAKGCKRLALTLIALIVLFSLCAQLLTTDGGRIKVEKITIDARGAALEGELYYPVGTTDEDSYPGVVIVPGAGNIYQMLRCYAEELAHRGYVVFSINAYGSGASETPVYNENDQGILEYNIFGTPMGCLDAVNFMRGLEFVDKIGRADRDNAIDVYISDEYMDVLADGMWEKTFTEKPEVFTKEEKRAWLDQMTDVTLGSDAFFPFSDNIERAHKSGVKYIAQPGGSVRDDAVIETCNKYGMVMSFTGIRLFHH